MFYYIYINKMEKSKVLIRSIGHIIITLPSIIYHGLIHKFNHFIYKSSEIIVKNNKVIPINNDIAPYIEYDDNIENEIISRYERKKLHNDELITLLESSDSNSSLSGFENDSEKTSLSSIDFSRISTPTRDHMKTVVFIHGKGGNPCHFDFIVENFIMRYKDKYNIFVPYLGNNNHSSIEDDANILLNRLYARDISLNNLILVGLSKGGLVASYFATNFNSVEKIITISSPMMGTKMADLHWNKNVRSALGYMNEEVVALSQTANMNRYYHIVPKYDHVINPIESSYYSSTSNNNIYYYEGLHSHIGVTHSSDICDKILSWIDEP